MKSSFDKITNNKRDRTIYHTFICSSVGAFLVTIIATPFDVIKNYSVYTLNSSEPLTFVVKQFYQQKGLKSFFTGFSLSCLNILPSNFVFFVIYEYLSKSHYIFFSGIVARLTAILITAPGELVKTALQANAGKNLSSLLKSAGIFRIVQASRFSLLATALRDIPFSAIYWPLNEEVKCILYKFNPTKTHLNSFVYPFISGSVSSFVATIASHPFDVTKTKIQGNLKQALTPPTINKINTLNLTFASSQIWRTLGIRGFFIGLKPRLLKSVASCAVLLATYDYLQTRLTNDINK